MGSKLTTWSLVLLLVITVALTGGRKRQGASEPPPTEVQGNTITQNIGKAPAQNDIQRGAERQVDQGMLKELASFYIQYGLNNGGRAPANLEEFLAANKDMPKK